MQIQKKSVLSKSQVYRNDEDYKQIRECNVDLEKQAWTIFRGYSDKRKKERANLFH